VTGRVYMGSGFQLVVGAVLLLWGSVVVIFPRIVIKIAEEAEKARLAWDPQARWGTVWIRALGGLLGCAGLVMLVGGVIALAHR
jgi:hypothetical protein